MTLNSGVDTITFQYSGTVGRYSGKFLESNDVYEVSLCPLHRTRDRQLRNFLNPPLNHVSTNYTLTIIWNKVSRKFIKIKVLDEKSMLVFIKEKIFVNYGPLMKEATIALDNKPVVFVIKTHLYDTIAPVRGIEPLQEPGISNDGEQVIKKDIEQLSADIKNALDTNMLTDLIMTNGIHEMKVHKLILSARSSVFYKMFQHPTQENLRGVITITDIPFESLRVLVHYIYSGTVKLCDMKMARDLFIAADKYDIQHLKNICMTELKCMTLDHVLDNLLLANLYDVKDLKDSAFTFISENYSKVKNLENWSEFKDNNQVLALEVLSFALDR